MASLAASFDFVARAIAKVATDTNSDLHRAVHAALRDAWQFAESFPIGANNDDRFLLYLSRWVDKVKQVSHLHKGALAFGMWSNSFLCVF